MCLIEKLKADVATVSCTGGTDLICNVMFKLRLICII